MYMVLAVQTTIEVSVSGNIIELPFSQAGFLGICPVFNTEEEAVDWADGKAEVIKLSQIS